MAQAVTTPFWPVFVRKSDGHEVVTQKGIQIKNAPNAQQLDRTPNAQGQCDYYRLLDREEPKHIDWRKKLGGMLLRELGGKENEDKWSQTLLWDLPDGYRLYEHIKSKADGQAKAVKNHSGGGHDRQDAYLYGYPKGPKKRFRSPIEFFPHLLWLCTDDTNDNENCSCKMCSPVQIEVEKPAIKSEPTPAIKKEEGIPVSNQTALLNANATAAPTQQPISQFPIRRPSTGPAQSPLPKPATPIASSTQPPSQQQPAQQPQQQQPHQHQQQQPQPQHPQQQHPSQQHPQQQHPQQQHPQQQHPQQQHPQQQHPQQQHPQQQQVQQQTQHQHQLQQHQQQPSQAASNSKPVQAQGSHPAPVTPAPTLQPTLLPPIRSNDQQVDGQYHKFLARIGEIMWFHREKTRAWGLGLVIRRWKEKDNSGFDRPSYLIQPLSHPFDAPTPEIIQSDDRLKPWLAWSAPSCTYAFLQQNPHLSYDQVDWRALISGQYGDGNPEVDASILAAKAIDVTYTLFEPLKTSRNANYEERLCNGIFLGAERIWNGEPVRLRMGSGTDIMVVSSIVERISPTTQNGAPESSVNITGDVYAYATVQVPIGQTPPQIPQSSNIPIRMREDMAWRNRILLEETRSIAYWKLIATQRCLSISEVKGRWYEASIVFVDPFKAAVQKKEGGNGIWMNSRGDATGIGQLSGVKKEDRIQAFGHAVPKNSVLLDGTQPPSMNDHGKAHGNEMQSMDLGGGVGTAEAPFALDDFMNLEGMEGDHMAFEDHFTF